MKLVCIGALVSAVIGVSWPAPASAQDPEGSGSPANYADGGELSGELLEEALREGTPEEIEQRRADIAARLEQAGTVEEFVRGLETEATVALGEIDAELLAAQADLVQARAGAERADAALAVANSERSQAAQRAEVAEADLRESAIDLFINPPQAQTVMAALTGSVSEEMASTGVLVGRAEARRAVWKRRDRARAAAVRAADAAERAAQRSREAIAEVQDATAAIEARLAEQTAELVRIRTELDLAREEVADLQLTDVVLETRLVLGSLATTGRVTARQDDAGNWIPEVEGLPARAEMVRIGTTSVWMHNLVAPSAFAMFLAAMRDGVVLGGSAYRDSVRQIELRASHCGTSYEAIFTAPSSSCSPPTARPGQSMHERGLAIDFTDTGGRVLTRSSPEFAWLTQNAADFGFFNLPSEPWHWSVNGH